MSQRLDPLLHPLRRKPLVSGEDEDTELDRMLAGELYYGFDPALLAMRVEAKKLYCQLNKMDDISGDAPERMEILEKLLGKIGTGCYIESPFRCDYGKFISLGKNVYMNFNTTILDCNRVEIGDDVLFGPNVSIYAAYHPIDPELRTQYGPEIAKPVKIGNNVWIGGNVVILHGVTIGDGTTIGAGSVVTKDIPARCVAVGNPARVIKHIE